MKYTEDQIQEAIQLAEKIAGAELMKEETEEIAEEVAEYNKEHSKRILDMWSDVNLNRIGRCHAELLTTGVQSLVEELLPQARVAVRMRRAREMALYNGPIGELNHVIITQNLIERGKVSFRNSASLKCSDRNKVWKKFLTALKKGEKAKMLDKLGDILHSIQREIENTELPPLPPKYKIKK